MQRIHMVVGTVEETKIQHFPPNEQSTLLLLFRWVIIGVIVYKQLK